MVFVENDIYFEIFHLKKGEEMKKLCSIIAIVLFSAASQPANAGICGSCDCKAISHTFFTVRPQYQSGSPEKESLFYDRMNIREDGRGGGLQIALFGGRSTYRDELGNFFSPFCQKSFYVRETGKIPEGDQNVDIVAQHFNIALADENIPFESRISFCPRLTVFGLGLTYRQNLSQLWSDDEYRTHDVWVELSTPITRVETNMCLSETILTEGERTPVEVPEIDKTFFSSITEALKQNAWCYGKIDSCCENAKWRLADLEIKGGLQRRLDKCCYGGYIGLLIPTGNRPCATCVFEPIVGHNKHFGFTKGSFAKFEIWESDDSEWKIKSIWNWHSQYLFAREEKRSFDLKYKPWSRYMEVYSSKEQAQMAADFDAQEKNEAALFLSTPGINIFTQCMNVKPRFSTNVSSAFVFSGKKWSIEAGYNFYARSAECIELCCWPDGIALKAETGSGRTNSARTINKNNVCLDKEIENYESNIITKCDLDLESAAHPGMVSHTMYGSAGYRWDEKEYPMLIAFGGSYEYGDANFVLSRWTAWAKYTFSF